MRTLLLQLLRLALRLRSRRLALPDGLLLVIAPHQDDESLGCGGLLSARQAAGLPTRVLFLTDGAASHPGHPALAPAALAVLRREEATAAAVSLGLDPAHLDFLDLPDGRLPSLDSETRATALRAIAARLDAHRPASLLLPLFEDGSSEHVAAHRLVREALALGPSPRPRLLGYPVWAAYSPRLLFRLVCGLPCARRHVAPPAAIAAKRRAIAAYASQIRPVPPWTRPVLPAAFLNVLSRAEEFFFELSPRSFS